MKIKLFLFFIVISFNACSQQNAQNKYGLKVVNDFKVYKADLAKNPNLELVDIKKAIPSVVLDIRYATKNNFMKQVMYKQARAFARKPVVEKLKLIQAALKKSGYGLKIYDGYRPYAVTVSFYEKASDKNFVANPAKGSKHNRGCAVDLSIIDLKTGKDVPMPTPYDSFEAAAAPHYNDLPADIIKNRDFLINTMQAHGFKVIYNEWWHFDFIGWQDYDLMDIPFEKL
ncbi:MAG: D-alanyl-D-alanine dipeptidase [Chitinophagaceae bacterium]|nr:MAG: D-alanyl-D-alanine dipeptidase [Chitinophagaceae bacterium]